MWEVAGIVVLVVVALYALRAIKSMKRAAKMHKAHASFAQSMRLEEAALALHENVSGVSLAREMNVSRDLISRRIEVAASLYEYVRRLQGRPITKVEKSKFRMQLACAAAKGNARNWAENRAKLMRYMDGIPNPEINDRTNMDEAVLQMSRAV